MLKKNLNLGWVEYIEKTIKATELLKMLSKCKGNIIEKIGRVEEEEDGQEVHENYEQVLENNLGSEVVFPQNLVPPSEGKKKIILRKNIKTYLKIDY